MPTREVLLGPELFAFESKRHWVNKGRSWYAPYRPHEHVTLDALGRVVASGAEFARAERDTAYPVRVYLIDPDGEPRGLTPEQMSAELRRRWGDG